jgi:mannose-6-phosphate isomerase-like protein (cupin superfamily)
VERARVLEKVVLAEKLALFAERWSPKVVGAVNDTAVKLVKLQGEFVWHRHEREDELFLVLRGRLRMKLPDGELVLGPGEMVIVPRGVEHCPCADEECHVLLVEPATTLNTGDARDARTVERPERI